MSQPPPDRGQTPPDTGQMPPDMGQMPPGTGQTPPGPPPIRIGVTLGRYQVQEQLGNGPYGPIYRGYDPAVARSVIVEVLDAMREPQVRERLASVAPLLTGLRHPNLLHIQEVGERDGLPYLIADHVEAVRLADVMRGGITIDGALRILQGIARGVDYLHAEGVLHGDLRPATVLLGPESRPLVAEVGLVPLLDTGFRGAAFGIRSGGLHYQAPEQIERGEINVATDRYAFASVAYQLLTGATPFPGQTTSDILAAKERTEPLLASSRNQQLGHSTDAVLATGLSRDPNARWQSCEQMVQALMQAVADDAYRAGYTYTPPVETGPAAARPRRTWPWALGILALLAGLAAIAVAVWAATQQPAQPSVSLSTGSVQAGGSITVMANHLPAGQAGTVELHSNPVRLGNFQADQGGNLIGVQVTIPADTPPGGHTIDLCWNGTCPAQTDLTVQAAPPSPTPSPSPTPTPSPTPSPTPTSTPTPKATPSHRPTLPPLPPPTP